MHKQKYNKQLQRLLQTATDRKAEKIHLKICIFRYRYNYIDTNLNLNTIIKTQKKKIHMWIYLKI